MATPTLDEPIELQTLAAHQAGAVVSQTLLKTPGAGTVTLFAFAAGEGLSEHTAPFDALVLVVDGRATITVGGTAHAMTAGQILRMPASVPHAVRAEEDFRMLLIMLRPATVAG